MFWPRKKKSESLYYMLPGMTRSNRRVRRIALVWAVLVALAVAALLCAALVFIGKR